MGQLPKLGRWDLIDMKNLNQLLELPWLGFAGCQRIFSLVQIHSLRAMLTCKQSTYAYIFDISMKD